MQVLHDVLLCRWEIEADNETAASDLDPEGRDFNLNDMYEPIDEEAQQLMDDLYDDEMYGDPVWTWFVSE
jgi:hypothetical protein